MTLYARLRPLLFRLDPERAHGLSLAALRFAGAVAPLRGAVSWLFARGASEPVQLFGLTFPNRVGLAAGYDKDGVAWRGAAALGFGHVEIGTVTPRAQPGQPRPRLFRLTEDRALINRLGFPSRGARVVAANVGDARPRGVVVGVNLGKNRDTPLERAGEDYRQLVETFAGRADYLAVNVSSPNTPGLRGLQRRAELQALLASLIACRDALAGGGRPRTPLLVKLSPDLDDDALDDALEAVTTAGADGIIATNTTLERPGVSHPAAREPGGLSGAPLEPLSTGMVARIVRRTGGRLPVIGVGGIDSPEDALRKLDAGASLVQLYTGLVYEGPGLPGRIARAIERRARAAAGV